MKIKLKNIAYMFTGSLILLNSIVAIDMSTMIFKNDLYTIDYLGFMNQFFSTDIKISIVQTAVSFLCFFLGYVLMFKGLKEK